MARPSSVNSLVFVLFMVSTMALILSSPAKSEGMIVQEATGEQHDVLNRLPNTEGVYIVVGDMPNTARSIATSFRLEEPDFEAAWRVVSSVVGSTDNLELSREDDELRHIYRMFDNALLGKPFEGQFVIGIVPTSSNVLSLFAAGETSLSKEEMEAFLRDAYAIVSPSRKATARNGGRPEKSLPKLDWDVDGGWFCIAQSESIRKEYLGYLTGANRIDSSLRENRDVERALRGLRNQMVGSPAITAIVTEKYIGLLSELVDPHMFGGFNYSWKDSFDFITRSEFRCAAWSISIGDGTNGDSSNFFPAVLCGHLPYTHPSKALGRVVVGKAVQPVDSLLPPGKLDSLTQFSIDGPAAAEYYQEVFNRQSSDEVAFRTLKINFTLGAKENETVFSMLRRSTGYLAFDISSEENQYPFLRTKWRALQVEGSDTLDKEIADYLSQFIVGHFSSYEFPQTWKVHTTSSDFASYSRDPKTVASMNEVIQGEYMIALRHLETMSEEDVRRMYRLRAEEDAEAALRAESKRYGDMRREMLTPEIDVKHVRFRDWLIMNQLTDADVDLLSQATMRHDANDVSRIADLATDLADIRDLSFGKIHILAYRSPRAIEDMLLEQYKTQPELVWAIFKNDTEPFLRRSMVDPKEFARRVNIVRLFRFANLLIEDSQGFVLIGNNNESGFYFRGALTKAAQNAEHN